MASYANISADQGANFQVNVDLEDANSDPLNLTHFTMSGQIRRTYKSENFVNFSVSIVGNANNGAIVIELTASQTSNMKAGRYVYDVYATHTESNDVIKVLEGIFEIIPSVTKSVN